MGTLGESGKGGEMQRGEQTKTQSIKNDLEIYNVFGFETESVLCLRY